ncbi:hypothetical protein QYF36_010194 [Acer negundo]|nr:hypothetical protein QYF36_010194 [Acer negundo]
MAYIVGLKTKFYPFAVQFSFEYLLLPPRFAPTATPPELASWVLQRPPRPPTHRGLALAPMAGYRSRAPTPSIFGAMIRQVSCYTLLSGFRLPRRSTTQICTDGRSARAHALGFTPTAVPSYSSGPSTCPDARV